jgi:hypothetical protein
MTHYPKIQLQLRKTLKPAAYTITISHVVICNNVRRSCDRASLMYSFSITNKMQHCTVFFIAVNALHVSGGFSTHHQELKTLHTESRICQACLLLPLAVRATPDAV